MMINRRMFSLLLIPAMFGVACSDVGNSTGPGAGTGSAGTGSALAQFVETWVATGFELANLANLSQVVDEIALGGAFNLIVSSDERFTIDEFVPPDAREPVEPGTSRITGDNTLVLDFDDKGADPAQVSTVSVVYQFSDSGQTVTLVSDEAEFDGDGVDDITRVTLVLVKQ